ncbi:hypothetical protein [Streptomyces sp. NPDC096153]|uniref:golvesin C-terminal-like domain-containing protein n=1 Tax=Streptomyces sp. NPDC096153 TaxID=3155548 RepID=UPI003327CE32
MFMRLPRGGLSRRAAAASLAFSMILSVIAFGAVPAAALPQPPTTCDNLLWPSFYRLGDTFDKFMGLGFSNCQAPDDKIARVRVDRHDMPTLQVCVPPGEQSGEIGFIRTAYNVPLPPDEQRLRGEVIGNWRFEHLPPGFPCESIGSPVPRPLPTPPPPPPGGEEPPQVSVNGRVETLIRNREQAKRALNGARYELWYEGKDGSADSEARMRPVRGGDDGTGEPVTGHLGTDGEYDITFVYPRTRTLPDGTVWHGCEPTGEAQLCAAENVVLHVFPENADASVVVKTPNLDITEPAHTIHLGSLPPSSDHHLADSPAALAYGGAYNVKDVWPDIPGGDPSVTIKLQESGISHYNPSSGNIGLQINDAQGATTEHEVVHRFHHVTHGDGTFVNISNCNPHYWNKRSSVECAWSEGLADFVAVFAEDKAAQSVNRGISRNGGFDVDLETCKSGSLVCSPSDYGWYGEEFEFRVAGALWDLTDAQNEIFDGFTDEKTYELNELFEVIQAAKPRTLKQFWLAWRSRHGDGDREIMFMNALLHTQVQDDKQAQRIGNWAPPIPCSTCRAQNYTYSLDPRDAERNRLTWNFDQQIKKPGRYDVWVRIDASGIEASPKALYKIDTPGGIRTYTFNQATAAEGWHSLAPDGIYLDSADLNQVVLSNGDSHSDIFADAVLIAPHDE